MFKKVYQFAFAFVFLLTCSFFVSDNVFAYTGRVHTGNITIEKPSSETISSSLYNQYLSVLNYYQENYANDYPYYFFYYSNNSFTYYIFTDNNYNGNSYFQLYCGGEEYSFTGITIFLYAKNNNMINPSSFSLSSQSYSVAAIFGKTSNTYSNYVSTLTRTLYIDTNISLFANTGFDNVIINNFNYSQWDIINDLYSSPIELDTKINGSNSNQLNSIDVYLDSTVENDGEYNFSLAIQDLYDYTNSNASYGDISGFSFKGLVNDNGLYHWETITNNNDFYVDYVDDDWTNNSSESCLNIENSSSGCTGYSFKGTAYYDMTGYEQIKFSIDVYNTREYFIKYDDDYDSVSSDYIDLNYYFLGDETGQRYGRTSSKGYRYMFFSAYGDLVNTELNNYYVIIRSNHYNQYNDVPIFFNKFNNSSYYFLDYDDNNVYTLKKLNNYTYLRYAFEIGETSATGFYTDLNADDIFTYEVYIPDNLYFSYTNDATESTFINSSGEVVDDGIFPDTNISITNINSYSNIFESALHYFTEPIRFIFLYFGDFFDTLPIALKYTLISTFTLSIVIIVIKFII